MMVNEAIRLEVLESAAFFRSLGCHAGPKDIREHFKETIWKKCLKSFCDFIDNCCRTLF